MAKPKRSMSDALAEIAAQAPPASVTTSERGNTNHGAHGTITSGDVPRDNVTTSRTTTTPDGFKIRQRIERPHASIYAHPKVFKAVREIAAAEGRKPHDLFIDGLRLVLQSYGRDLDKLNRGE